MVLKLFEHVARTRPPDLGQEFGWSWNAELAHFYGRNSRMPYVVWMVGPKKPFGQEKRKLNGEVAASLQARAAGGLRSMEDT